MLRPPFSEEGVAKPDPAIYEIALQRLDAQPLQAAFVDGMTANVEVVCELEMAAVQCRTREQTIAAVDRILADTAG